MGEVKQTNFRIDTETADRFRTFCEESGMNQAQGFDHIMAVLEMDKAKAAVPERITEIEEFERHTKLIMSAYLNSLEIAKTTEERILEQFRSKLDSKDQQIMKLQGEIRAKEELATAANTAAMDAENKQHKAEADMKVALDRAVSAEKTALDKASIADMLTEKLTEAEAKLKDYPALKESVADLKTQLEEAHASFKAAQKDAEIAQERAVTAVQKEADKALAAAELAQERAVAAVQKEADKALADAEKEKNKAVADAEREKNQIISQLQAEIAGLKATAAEKDKQLSKMESKNEDLQNLIADLRTKNTELEMKNQNLMEKNHKMEK